MTLLWLQIGLYFVWQFCDQKYLIRIFSTINAKFLFRIFVQSKTTNFTGKKMLYNRKSWYLLKHTRGNRYILSLHHHQADSALVHTVLNVKKLKRKMMSCKTCFREFRITSLNQHTRAVHSAYTIIILK